MTEIKVIQGWNGKWHIFEKDLFIEPARPANQGYYREAQPERQSCLTLCGQRVYKRNEAVLTEYPKRLSIRGWCSNCAPVLRSRLDD